MFDQESATCMATFVPDESVAGCPVRANPLVLILAIRWNATGSSAPIF